MKRWWLWALGALSLARFLTGADDLTSSGTAAAALRLTVPILLAGLGGLCAERAGIVNIGLEGMMVLGTFGAAWGTLRFGLAGGLLAAAAFGAAGGLLHGTVTVKGGVDQIVSGVAVNLLAAGVVRFAAALAWSGTPGAGVTASPRLPGGAPTVSAPFLAGGPVGPFGTADILGRLEATGIPLVADTAGLTRGLVSDVSLLTVAALALVPLVGAVLWRTTVGLRVRACGEHPGAADTAGVPVDKVRIAAVAVSGALAGLGGAFLVVEGAGAYQEGQTNGRGFIGLAALIFGNWRPGGVAAGAGLFGFADALQLRDPDAARALAMAVALALAALTGVLFWARRPRRGLAAAAGGVAAGLGYAAGGLPATFVSVIPHLATLAVLAVGAGRLQPPAALGRIYRRCAPTP